MPNEPTILRINRASKRFENTDSSFELFVPQLEVQRGRVYVVMGRSGCGKTTLLDALGMISPWTHCAEHRITDAHGNLRDALLMRNGQRAITRRSEIGYILQQGGLLPFLTAWENILLPLGLTGKMRWTGYARELVEHLGVEEQMQYRPAALSIGQRQRVCIARALALRPALILADEPTGALDPMTAADVREILLRVATEQGSAVVVVTHDVELFSERADVSLGFRLERRGNDTLSTLRVQDMREEVYA